MLDDARGGCDNGCDHSSGRTNGGRRELIRSRQPPIASARRGLLLLRSELNREILRALDRRPMTEAELKDWLVVSSRNTLRKHLKELLEGEAIERCELRGVPRGVENRLTSPGRGLLELLEIATRWVVAHPERPLESVSPVGWRAFAALADAWEAAILECLACEPHSEAELSEAIVDLGEGKIERELHRLLGAGLIEEVSGAGGETRYALTEWGRRGIGVLAAAGRWEATCLPERCEPISVHDAVVALLVALPLARLPERASGLCTLTAEVEPGSELRPRVGAVWARIEAGRVVSCAAGSPPSPPVAWVHGPFSAWFEAVVDGRPGALQPGGDRALVRALLAELHTQLFGYE